jgi:hypothetical protein
MALDIKRTLDILKRAGFDPNDRMKSSDMEQRLQQLEQDPYGEDGIPVPVSADTDAILQARDRHANPENLDLADLLNIEDF